MRCDLYSAEKAFEPICKLEHQQALGLGLAVGVWGLWFSARISYFLACVHSVKTARLVVLMGGTLSPFESLTRFVRCLPPSSYMFLSADTGTASDRVLALPISRRECLCGGYCISYLCLVRVGAGVSIDSNQINKIRSSGITSKNNSSCKQQRVSVVVLCVCGAVSSSCSDFCFEFSQRIHFPMQFVSLLRLLLCVSGTVSGGVVVFFPSFATLQSFLAVAGISDGDAGRDVAASAAAAPIMTELKKLGPIFAERRAPGPTKVDAGNPVYLSYHTAASPIPFLSPELAHLSVHTSMRLDISLTKNVPFMHAHC